MMKKILVFLVACALALSFASLSSAQEHQKSSWYIGFGIGSGSAKYEGDSAEDKVKDLGATDPEAGTPITLNFGVGAILNPNLHLGLDISALRESVKDDPSDGELSSQINNYFLAATFFPMGEGLSLKAGVGMSALVLDLQAPGIDESETYSGWGWLIGAGYQLWLGEHFNLGIHVEYSKQTYNDSDAPDDTDFFSVYVSFYWF
jgi:opacity protein-like surface antigen